MADNITDLEGLRLIAWSLEGGNATMAAECRLAAAEIVRLRAVLDAIDALHQPNWHDNSGRNPKWCDTCDEVWPCDTHLLIHPQEARRG